MRVGYNPKLGRIKTDAKGVVVDRAFLAHIQVSEADAVAASANGVRSITLGVAAQPTVTTGITNPAVPRGLSIVGNVAGITGNVVITGTNYGGEAISETLALNGTTTVPGAKAFKTITNIAAPVQVHTPVAQVETATAAGTVTVAGNATVTVTSALQGADVVTSVPVEVDDDASAIALAIRTALAANASITANFTVSGATDKVILTAKLAAANDTTLNIAIADGTSTGVTTAASSANTTAGVVADIISVGWTDKLGLPYLLDHNTVWAAYHDKTLEGTPATVTVSATAIESNTVDLNTTLNGKRVDIYLIV
jgi:hypothetical protein